jgi:hypothetical protein
MRTVHLASRAAGVTAALSLLLTLTSMPAHAGDAPEGKADNPKVVCTKERSTGSHLPRRVCVSQAEHEERRKQDQAAMERLRSKPAGTDRSGR